MCITAQKKRDSNCDQKKTQSILGSLYGWAERVIPQFSYVYAACFAGRSPSSSAFLIPHTCRLDFSNRGKCLKGNCCSGCMVFIPQPGPSVEHPGLVKRMVCADGCYAAQHVIKRDLLSERVRNERYINVSNKERPLGTLEHISSDYRKGKGNKIERNTTVSQQDEAPTQPALPPPLQAASPPPPATAPAPSSTFRTMNGLRGLAAPPQGPSAGSLFRAHIQYRKRSLTGTSTRMTPSLRSINGEASPRTSIRRRPENEGPQQKYELPSRRLLKNTVGAKYDHHHVAVRYITDTLQAAYPRLWKRSINGAFSPVINFKRGRAYKVYTKPDSALLGGISVTLSRR
ncbi:hypothetical protein C8R44DRAFT_744746 [Mycena epipterygia]|nr:hypothetical protein C8R44DRAFT_744746 [Mycena epipterygia]